MIRPLNDNVVLKKERVVKQTASGIVLSQHEEEKEYAIVVAVGSGKKNDKGEVIPLEVKIGQKVIYNCYSPTKVKYDDEEYIIVSADEILAIID
ncbi:MAG: co-chaperone GroES [Anaeroplasmataceae bacterium]